MVKTLIFDVDGTLLDTERIYVQSWLDAGEARGYAIPMEILRFTRGRRREESKACFQKHFGADFPYEAMLQERVRLSEQRIAAMTPEALRMPHALELLRFLKERGYRLAAATSTVREKTLSHLAHARLLEYFDAIVCGDMVTRGKPEPDIFLKAAELTDTPPDACLVVGDTPADVLAAAAAGMPMVLIPDQVQADARSVALCWKCLENLRQLQSLLESE